ncbi:MAG: hypothetical protein ACYS8W_08335 [Planctomycetota bacterium]|jgi:hypothetical protein
MKAGQSGEVSNRFILGMTVAVVLIVIVVPILCLVLPRALKTFRKEKLVLIFEETFEKQEGASVHSGSSSAACIVDWDTWGHTSYGKVCKGKLGICLFGRLRGISSAGFRRELISKPPFVLEFDVYMGDEPFNPGTHQFRAGAYMHAQGGGQYGRDLIHFLPDGCARIIQKRIPSLRWKPGKWYHVRVRYEHSGEKYVVSVKVDDTDFGPVEFQLAVWQRKWENAVISFHSGTGTSYFDNIRLSRVISK